MIKVSDYIARRVQELGIRHVFMITGGGAMHLNMSFGRQKGLECVFNHHEQASAMAAESYARLGGKMAAVCVTSGPGGTNAITGVLGAWLDSIPMLVVSGQVRYDTTVRSTGLPLRQLGDQEFDIAKAVSTMTKYSVMVINPADIAYHLEKAVYLAAAGRPGPCWLDVPLNVQGAFVEESSLRHYDPSENRSEIPPEVSKSDAAAVLAKIKASRRPVIIAGTGIRLGGAHDDFLRFVDALGIPVVTAWNAQDCIHGEHPLYFGRPSTVGDRAGNFIVQNSDLLISVGCRLNVRQIGYNFETFARKAFKIVVDIDPIELKKPTLRIDMPVHADSGEFIRTVLSELGGKTLEPKAEWIKWCAERKRLYPVVLSEYWEEKEFVNPYCFISALGEELEEGEITVLANGSACICGLQALPVKRQQRIYTNSGCASMGYDLPAAVGAAVAAGKKKRIVCIAGDGSVQMNLQELQTIVRYKLPVKLFVINNNGYHSIVQTQANFFGGEPVGCGPSSGVSFPDLGKIAQAYGVKFIRCSEHSCLKQSVRATLDSDGFAICEIIASPKQPFAPKSASKTLPDGKIVSAPLEDMWPFLERGEFLSNMIIDPVS